MPETPEPAFHARLEESGGVFRAVFRDDVNKMQSDPGVAGEASQKAPDSHIGTDADSVKAFVETLARNRGYSKVSWEN